MHYRRLTEAEIAIFIEEQTVYARWQAYATFAQQVYGPNAARIVVASDLVYNDETDVLSITDLNVFDSAGRLLEPDWSNDWWQQTLDKQQAMGTVSIWNSSGWLDQRELLLYQAQRQLPIPPRRDDVAVQTPPPMRFPVVYVPDDATHL